MADMDKIAGGIEYPDTRNDCEISCRDMLELVKFDIYRDVSGGSPLSGINYIWVTVQFMVLFTTIEGELKRVRNPLYHAAYEPGGPFRKEKRAGLVAMALKGEDEECLRIMARAFEKLRSGLMTHIYWEDLDDHSEMLLQEEDESMMREPCAVM